MACVCSATQVYVKQQFSNEVGLALFFAFMFGVTTIYGSMNPLQRGTLSPHGLRILSVLHFVCLFIISGMAGWMVGGLLAFSNTNFIAFSILLYFLGLRLGAHLQFYV
ncbi:hypothetical protein [Catalinimonas niigatensis]|uniref:hypothetical protein n=1 Tax=Catalinimonas niigatensis TaxID=1397264 RepID=UPI0026663E2D|nr:hypothetical protein [Catalinimonas niigatensis]WPP52788.1 hypothetical protein PZB72_10405 [Catalinimonas niigatensis]